MQLSITNHKLFTFSSLICVIFASFLLNFPLKVPHAFPIIHALASKMLFSTAIRDILHPDNPVFLNSNDRETCYKTCTLRLVESVPENLTFHPAMKPSLLTTYDSWKMLIESAERDIILAAYKSSFRSKHVFHDEKLAGLATLGDDIFDSLRAAAGEKGVRLEAVENFPPKDPGDNEDLMTLSNANLLNRRRLNMGSLFNSGVMHSKFFIVDDAHFYLGSANFDWRSLNQKMELGVQVQNCPCLARDLKFIYDSYRKAADAKKNDGKSFGVDFAKSPSLTSKVHPLVFRYDNVDTEAYLAASPKRFNGPNRAWDLDAILDTIASSKNRLDINVMDYVPLYVYSQPYKFWPVIDQAIRRAVVERRVQVRILTAALHFAPESLQALQSLRALHGVSNGSIEIRILNVPAVTEFQKLLARERRTHRKFVVNDDSLLIGTSNWSGDYFANTTGVAIVLRQKVSGQQPLIDQARSLFIRDWNSDYATDLDGYVRMCYDAVNRRDRCKVEKTSTQRSAAY